MINPIELTEGGTRGEFWSVPNSDAKGSTDTLVDFSVGTQRTNIRGVPLKVWSLTYTGDVLGYLYNPDGVYSKGRETDTYLYDSVYGILVGYSWKLTAEGEQVGGSWTEDCSSDELIEDTNLSFSATTAPPDYTTPPDFTMLIIGGAIVTIAIIVAAFFMTRKRAPALTPTREVPPPAVPVPPQPVSEQ